jgi:hypothetical protein
MANLSGPSLSLATPKVFTTYWTNCTVQTKALPFLPANTKLRSNDFDKLRTRLLAPGSDSTPAVVRDLTHALAKRYQLICGQALVNFMQSARPEYFYINRGDRS